jgi:hypothetical protein
MVGGYRRAEPLIVHGRACKSIQRTNLGIRCCTSAEMNMMFTARAWTPITSAVLSVKRRKV